MKKIISMGVASAVLALTAVVASADATNEAYLDCRQKDGNVATGENISIEVFVTKAVNDGAFVVKTEGLEYVSVDTNGEYNEETKALAFAKGSGYKEGDVIATFTYKVTAADGETVSFALADHSTAPGAVSTTPITAVVGGTTSSEPTSSDNSDPVTSSDESNNSGANNNNPGTGIALAVVPAVIAGAAVVVAAKKRK